MVSSEFGGEHGPERISAAAEESDRGSFEIHAHDGAPSAESTGDMSESFTVFTVSQPPRTQRCKKMGCSWMGAEPLLPIAKGVYRF